MRGKLCAMCEHSGSSTSMAGSQPSDSRRLVPRHRLSDDDDGILRTPRWSRKFPSKISKTPQDRILPGALSEQAFPKSVQATCNNQHQTCRSRHCQQSAEHAAPERPARPPMQESPAPAAAQGASKRFVFVSKRGLLVEPTPLDEDFGQPFRLADHQHVARVDLD